MINRRLLTSLYAISLTLGLSACNSNDGSQMPEDNTASSEKVAINEVATTEQLQDEESSQAEAEPTSTEFSPEDYRDINSYTTIVHEMGNSYEWLTPFFIAQTTREIPKEEILNLLSAEYYNEPDSFKKNDLEQQLWPEIQEQLASYEGVHKIKVPIISLGSTPDSQKVYVDFEAKNSAKGYGSTSITGPWIGPYDFSKEEFPIYVKYCGMKLSLSGGQNINLETPNSNQECPETIKVSDKEVARRIEELRVDETLGIRGDAYYTLATDENSIVANFDFADVTYIDEGTGEEIISQRLIF